MAIYAMFFSVLNHSGAYRNGMAPYFPVVVVIVVVVIAKAKCESPEFFITQCEGKELYFKADILSLLLLILMLFHA